VVREGMEVALVGLLIGLAVAFTLTRYASSMLYGITAHDPLTFATVGLLLGAIALLACYLPASRASKVDPTAALRYE
jgi:ABC-type antimicrobial peptide transport system permease subunit